MKKYIIIIPVLLVFYFITLGFKEKNLVNDTDNGVAVNIDSNHVEEGNTDNIVHEDDVSSDNKVVKEKSVTVSYNGENINISIDDYVLGVVACEVPALFDDEALKAMSVVARTFYLYKDSKSSSYVANNNDQCFNGESAMHEKWGTNYQKYYEIIKKAVDETAGEFITYNGELAQTFYFSLSNGKTENLENVFSEKRPYLVSVDSSWDKNVSSYEKTVDFTLLEFLNKLGLEKSESVVVDIVSRTESGRVESVRVNDVEFKGTEFRKKLGLRSADFDVYLSNKISITTRGYGHGVGMSQYGANEMAKQGFTYKDIIMYYYKGVEISTL